MGHDYLRHDALLLTFPALAFFDTYQVRLVLPEGPKVHLRFANCNRRIPW